MSIANIIVSDVDRNFNQPVYKNFANDLLSEKMGMSVMRRLQLRVDFDSTAVRLLIKDH